MTNEEAKKILQSLIPEPIRCDGKSTQLQIAEALIMGMDALDFKEKYRWVPVSEGSPKKSGRYWCRFGEIGHSGVDFYTTESDAKKLFNNPEEYTGWDSKNVIAWRPLPEDYKEDEEDEHVNGI